MVATVLQSVALMRAQAEVCGVPRGGCVAPITSSSPPTGESEVVEDLQCRLNCIQQVRRLCELAAACTGITCTGPCMVDITLLDYQLLC